MKIWPWWPFESKEELARFNHEWFDAIRAPTSLITLFEVPPTRGIMVDRRAEEMKRRCLPHLMASIDAMAELERLIDEIESGPAYKGATVSHATPIHFDIRPYFDIPTNQHQPTPRRSTMNAAETAQVARERTLGVAAPPEPDKMADIEAMCAQVSDIRETAMSLRNRAKDIEVRILGPTPAEEPSAIATNNVPCLTGVVGADTRETRNALRDLGYSLDRIVGELGSIGQQ